VFAVVLALYIRYHQLSRYLMTPDSPHPSRLNKAAFAVGLLAVFGITLVANFQVCIKPSYLHCLSKKRLTLFVSCSP